MTDKKKLILKKTHMTQHFKPMHSSLHSEYKIKVGRVFSRILFFIDVAIYNVFEKEVRQMKYIHINLKFKKKKCFNKL